MQPIAWSLNPFSSLNFSKAVSMSTIISTLSLKKSIWVGMICNSLKMGMPKLATAASSGFSREYGTISCELYATLCLSNHQIVFGSESNILIIRLLLLNHTMLKVTNFFFPIIT